MKYRVLNNGVLEFFDATANTVGSIGANGANMKITANTGVIELGNIPSDIQVGTAGTLTNWTFLGGGTIGAGGIGTISMGQSGDTVNMNVSGVLYQYPASFLRFNEISGANNKINITTQVPGSVILNLPNRPVVGQLSLTDNVPTSSNNAGTLTVAGGVGISGNVYSGTLNANTGFQLGSALDGTTPIQGTVKWSGSGASPGWFRIYDSVGGKYYGIASALPAPISAIGGYYQGMGVSGTTSSAGSPIFGVLSNSQSGNGLGNTALTVYGDSRIVTLRNTLDDNRGNANVTGNLTVGNTSAVYSSTSNTTGSLIVTGGIGITGNLFMSAANNYSLTTNNTNSYRLGWTDNYFTRSPTFSGMYFTGTFLSIQSSILAVESSSAFIARGVISNDSGNNTVLFAGSSPVRLQNTATSTSNTTGALIVGGGVGVAGNTFLNNSLAAVTTTTSAVNYLQVTGNTTSNPISLSAQGSDTDVGMNLVSKGAGSITLGTANNGPFIPGIQVLSNPAVPFGIPINDPFRFVVGIPGYTNTFFTLPGPNLTYIQKTGTSDLAFATGAPLSGTSSGNTQFLIAHTNTGGSSNYLSVTGNTTGGSPILSAQGGDANIGINLVPKGSGTVNITSTAVSTSNATGALKVVGGVGVTGNIYVGGTNAGVNGVYTDVLRYSANGLPWVMGSAGGGGASLSGYGANTVIVANSSGFLSNSNSFFLASNNAFITGNVTASRYNLTTTETALGLFAGTTQKGYGTAIGWYAGEVNQGFSSVAVGRESGGNNQGNDAVAIGNNAGHTSQGAGAIAIGYTAGGGNQGAGSIHLNANTDFIDGDYLIESKGLYIDPVRNNTANTANAVYYNPLTRELTYAPNNAVANIGPVITTNSAARVIIANTTASTSNTTGALVVTGGLGVAGDTFLNNSLAAVTTTGAVNYLSVTGNTTSNGPVLSAEGTSTNIDINIRPKGIGTVNVRSNGTSTSLNVINPTTGPTGFANLNVIGSTATLNVTASGSCTISQIVAFGSSAGCEANLLIYSTSTVFASPATAKISSTTGKSTIQVEGGQSASINIITLGASSTATANLQIRSGVGGPFSGDAGILIYGKTNSLKLMHTGTSSGSRFDMGGDSPAGVGGDFARANITSSLVDGVSSLRVIGGNRADFKLSANGASGFTSFDVESIGTSTNPVYANVSSTFGGVNVQILGAQTGAFAGFANMRMFARSTANLIIESGSSGSTPGASLKIFGAGSAPAYANIGSTTSAASQVNIISSLPSTSNTTGALVITGGVGVTGNLNVFGTAFFSSNTAPGIIVNNIVETANVVATAPGANVTVFLANNSIVYFTSNATANSNINYTYTSTTLLNSVLANGQSISAVVMMTQGSTAYFANTVSVDGTNINTRWQNGVFPAAGSPNGIDVYTHTIIKTGDNQFVVLGSQNKFA